MEVFMWSFLRFLLMIMTKNICQIIISMISFIISWFLEKWKMLIQHISWLNTAIRRKIHWRTSTPRGVLIGFFSDERDNWSMSRFGRNWVHIFLQVHTTKMKISSCNWTWMILNLLMMLVFRSTMLEFFDLRNLDTELNLLMFVLPLSSHDFDGRNGT